MDVFAAAKRQYRLQLRPDEVLAEASWADSLPTIEEVNSALAQLAEWGNLDSQPLSPVPWRRGSRDEPCCIFSNAATQGRITDRCAGRHCQPAAGIATTDRP